MSPAEQADSGSFRNGFDTGSVRLWEIAFMALLSAALVSSTWIKCHRTYLGHDELITALLVGKTSLGNLLDGIRHGTETNPPLFFILEWLMVRVFGMGDFALCALPCFSAALAVPVLFLTVRRVTGAGVAALAVGFVFGLSRDVYLFTSWARYYGCLVLLGSLATGLFMRFTLEAHPRRRDYVFVFLTHTAMVYIHLYGLFFSGMVMAAHVALDWANGRLRWRLYGAIAGAWAAFGLWAPFLKRQLSVTKDGTFTPRLNVGTFFEELSMQTPLALILLLIGVLALLSWFAARPARESAAPASAPALAGMVTLACAWMGIAVGAWAASHVMRPFFMRRYVAPCVISWVLVLAVILVAISRLPRFGEALGPSGRRLPGWVPNLGCGIVLAFCIVWQPLRAWKEPPKPATAFVDHDFGNTRLPIVFEDPMDFLPRAFYPNGREYALVLDKTAAQASDGYYTKLNENYHGRWIPYYPELKITYYENLPAWPEFLAVDDELARTFDWLFTNKPELRAELLGAWAPGKKVYRVQRLQRVP